MACELYCCLLPQCEALRICRSGFPIATSVIMPRVQQVNWAKSRSVQSVLNTNMMSNKCCSILLRINSVSGMLLQYLPSELRLLVVKTVEKAKTTPRDGYTNPLSDLQEALQQLKCCRYR